MSKQIASLLGEWLKRTVVVCKGHSGVWGGVQEGQSGQVGPGSGSICRRVFILSVFPSQKVSWYLLITQSLSNCGLNTYNVLSEPDGRIVTSNQSNQQLSPGRWQIAAKHGGPYRRSERISLSPSGHLQLNWDGHMCSVTSRAPLFRKRWV